MMDCETREALRSLTAAIEGLQRTVELSTRYQLERETWTAIHMGIWISTTDTKAGFSPDHVDNTTAGFVRELQRVAQANVKPGSARREESPYGTELLPVADLTPIYNAKRTKLHRIFCCGLDTTRASGEGQNAAVVAEIMGSLTSARAYQQSGYLNSQLAFHEPNWFRPRMTVNGNDVLYGNLQQSHISKGHAGHLSIGIPNPYLGEPDVYLGKVQEGDLKVYAQMAQYIEGQQLLQRYPCLVIAEFLTGGDIA